MSGHAPSEISGRAALGVGFGFVLWLMSVSVAVFGFYKALEINLGNASAPIAQGQIPPAPRLQLSPGKALEALRAAEDARLHSYGTDPTGRVHVPIERAIDLFVERGGHVR